MYHYVIYVSLLFILGASIEFSEANLPYLKSTPAEFTPMEVAASFRRAIPTTGIVTTGHFSSQLVCWDHRKTVITPQVKTRSTSLGHIRAARPSKPSKLANCCASL